MATATATARIIEELYQGQIDQYCELALVAAVLYEYLATFTTEVEVIWTKKLSNPTTVIFVVNRYNILLQAVITASALTLEINNTTVCRIWAAVSNAPSLIFFATWAAFCALRAYSMSNCKVIYATVVLCFGLVPFGVNLYPVVMQIEASSSNSELGCTLDWTPSAVSRDLSASRGSVIICDVMVLYVTLKNTWTSYFNSNVPSPVQSSLRSLLVRNGSLCFVVSLILSCLQMSLWVTNEFQFFGDFTIQFTSILISRFILDLRELYYSSKHPALLDSCHSEPAQLTTVLFASTMETQRVGARVQGIEDAGDTQEYAPETPDGSDLCFGDGASTPTTWEGQPPQEWHIV